jgi:hypothetical protein
VASDTTPARPKRRFRRVLRWLGILLLGLILVLMSAWGALAIHFADTRPAAGGRPIAAAAFLLASIVLLLFVRPRRWGLGGFAALFAAVLVWYLLLKPSNDRAWTDDVARTPHAIIDGDRLTIRNVRNFDYRSADDYTSRWEERAYNLNRLRTADFMLVYWGSKAIAHAIVSFEFERDGRADNDYLAISIETRKEKGESYSAVQGFFRQYELVYVFGDERDLVRLRTNHRNEDVYLYRTNITPDHARTLLLSYARQANSLHDKPRFYNALTTNCITGVLDLANEQRGANARGLSWEIVFSGYAARRMYRNGHLDTSLPFEQLEARSRVNDVAHTADQSPHFSTMIRAGLPGAGHRN